MSRHTYPKKRRVDEAYPIRMKVVVPPGGLGNLLSEIHVWIRENLDPQSCENTSVTAIHNQATAYYFRTLDDAQAFLDAFPMLELADGLDKSNRT